MEFKDFVQILHPIIGGSSSQGTFVKTLFDVIVTEDGQSALDEQSEVTYRSYFNGKTGISRIAKKISPYIETEDFVTYIHDFSDETVSSLCDSFREYLPEIDNFNAGRQLADLFHALLKTAARTKRKSAPKDAQENTGTPPHDIISEKIFASGKAVADTWDKVMQAMADGASKIEGTESKDADDATAEQVKDGEQSVLDIDALSDDDKKLLKAFRNDCKEIMLYVIENDPASGPTVIWLSDTISEVVHKWQLRYREVENRVLRNLAVDILNTLNEYTYYISDVFLRYIPERNVLWFRNESWEEGNRLRDVLQPKSYELRCKIAKLYEALYPIPEDAQDDTETVEAEVVDDEPSSGAAQDYKEATVIQQQINVIQNGEKNFNLTNNGTMNFNF